LNPKLGRWINKQRKKKKNPDKYGALTVEQVEQLENLGFAWNQSV
jgi:Helicase associated domain